MTVRLVLQWGGEGAVVVLVHVVVLTVALLLLGVLAKCDCHRFPVSLALLYSASLNKGI